MPRPIELEEERRNFFVGDHPQLGGRLMLSYARRYGGRTRDASRFLGELELRSPDS